MTPTSCTLLITSIRRLSRSRCKSSPKMLKVTLKEAPMVSILVTTAAGCRLQTTIHLLMSLFTKERSSMRLSGSLKAHLSSLSLLQSRPRSIWCISREQPKRRAWLRNKKLGAECLSLLKCLTRSLQTNRHRLVPSSSTTKMPRRSNRTRCRPLPPKNRCSSTSKRRTPIRS